MIGSAVACGDAAEVVHRLALVLLVDHAGQGHEPGAARPLGAADVLDGEGGRVLGHAREHRHAPARGLDGGAQHRFLLLGRQRRVLAQRTEHDEPAAARVEAGLDVAAGAVQVEAPSSRNSVISAGNTPRQSTRIELFPPESGLQIGYKIQ